MRSLRLFVGLAVIVGVALGTASLAGAHAVLVSLSPEPEAVLNAPPDEVALTFDEPVSATSTAIRVFDPTGEQVAGVRSSVVGSVLSAPLPRLTETGSYTVAWKALSDDGHVVSGAYLFHLREATLKAPIEVADVGAATLPRALKSLGAIATWVGLVLVLGMCAVAVQGRVKRRLLLGGFAAALVGTAVVFAASIASVGAGLTDGFDVVLGTNSGKLSLVALLLSVVLVIGGSIAVRSGPDGSVTLTRATRIAIQVGAVLVLIAAALEGHAMALSPVAFSATLTVLHVGAALGWLSGLVWIERRSRIADQGALAADVRRRSPWAMALVVIVLGSGIGLVVKRVPAADLISSAYGLLAGLKLVLLAMAVPLAWMNRGLFTSSSPGESATPETASTSETPEGGDGNPGGSIGVETVERFRVMVRIEMLLLAAALVVGSVLGQISPPGGSGDVAGGSFSQKLAFGDGQVELTVDPGKRGMNEVHLTALGSDGRLMAGIDKLELSMSLPSKEIGPLKPELQEIAPGHATGYVRFPFAGNWRVVASTTVQKFTELSVTFTVPIGE